ncbi:MAG: hypothetical protein ABI564_10820 [Ideonella sp.]
MTANPDVAAPPTVDEIHLLGVPPLATYVDHVTRRSIDDHLVDQSRLIDQWRTAAQHYLRLLESESGLAEQARVAEIPASKTAWVQHIAAQADFAEGFNELPVAFAMVELDRLVVYQHNVSLTHAKVFSDQLDDAKTREDAVFSICLPPNPHPPVILSSRSSGGKFIFQSELSDVRAFSPRLFTSKTAQSIMTPNGNPPTGIAIPVGFGSRHLNVVRLGKRMVLNNGYHRAYALRAAGIERVPCVIQAIAHPEELAFAGGSSLVDNFDDLFKSPRPPLFKDFFDPQLTTRLKLHRTRKQVQISISIETLRVPA